MNITLNEAQAAYLNSQYKADPDVIPYYAVNGGVSLLNYTKEEIIKLMELQEQPAKSPQVEGEFKVYTGVGNTAWAGTESCNSIYQSFGATKEIAEHSAALLCEAMNEQALLESRLRDMQFTYQFGADVMNKVVLPNCYQMNKGEVALDYLRRLPAEIAALKKMVEYRDKMFNALKSECDRWADNADRDGLLETARAFRYLVTKIRDIINDLKNN